MANGFIPIQIPQGPSAQSQFTGGLQVGAQLGGGIAQVLAQREQKKKQEQVQQLTGQAIQSTVPQQQLSGQPLPSQQTVQGGPISAEGQQLQATIAQQQQAGQPPNQDQIIAQLFAIDPEAGEKVFQSIGAISQQQKDNAAQRAFEIKNTPFANREAVIQRQAQELIAEGRDPSDTLGLLDMPQDTQDQALKTIQVAALPNEARLKFIGGAGNPNVQSSEILPDGSVISVTRDNQRVVTSPTGEVLQGQGAADAIRTAREFGAEIAGLRAGERTTGKETAQLRSNIKKQTVQTLRSAPVEIRKLNRISKIFEGAGTGTSKAFLTSIGKALPGATPASLEDALSASGEFVLNSLSRIKGPITEKELGFIQTLSPAVRNSPEGNKLIINRSIQAYQDELDLAKAQRSFQGNPEDFDVEGFIAEKEGQRDAAFPVPDQTIRESLGFSLTPESEQPPKKDTAKTVGRFTVEVE